MFRGPGANEMRSQFFDREQLPKLVVSTAAASYRHLGARYGMDADLGNEIDNRLAQARQAFEEVRKSIFLNRNIPIKGRTQLYPSLILSRLLYACSTWSDVTKSQLAQVEALITGHCRRIFNNGLWHAAHRLIYLQHLALHGHAFHIDLLLAEFTFQQGWLFEVRGDLQWLQQFGSLPFAMPTCSDDWRQVWEWLAQVTCTLSLHQACSTRNLGMGS